MGWSRLCYLPHISDITHSYSVFPCVAKSPASVWQSDSEKLLQCRNQDDKLRVPQVLKTPIRAQGGTLRVLVFNQCTLMNKFPLVVRSQAAKTDTDYVCCWQLGVAMRSCHVQNGPACVNSPLGGTWFWIVVGLISNIHARRERHWHGDTDDSTMTHRPVVSCTRSTLQRQWGLWEWTRWTKGFLKLQFSNYSQATACKQQTCEYTQAVTAI